MNRYDPDRPCAKCGAIGASTELYVTNDPNCRAYDGIETMARKCGRCGFAWYELPLDTPSAHQQERKG